MSSQSEMRQVIVLRRDLHMRQGKACAQTSHALLGAFLKGAYTTSVSPDDFGHPECIAFEFPVNGYAAQWIQSAFVKIVVRVDSDEELLSEYQKIVDYNATAEIQLPCALITDAGRTEFKGIPTRTCFGVGPGPKELIDKFTGHLKLM